MAEVTVSKCNEQLEGKKKRLMEELESAFTIATPMIPKPNCLGFGIEVIDETALLDCIPKNGKQQSRRRPSKKNTVPVTVTKDLVAAVRSSSCESVTEKKKKKYSRVMMESVRFVNVSQQRKFWKKIHAVLQSSFADEYDTLVVAATLNNRHALPFFPNKKPPILTGVSATNGGCRYVNVFVH